jgi:two-component system, NtrC family, nitrogen regulation response regulator GlnG
LPPLRERADDIPALARFFLQKSAKELGVEPKRISDESLQRLKAFPFPGNVRQLENICHWLTVMAPAQVIEFKDLPPEFQVSGQVAASGEFGTPPVEPALATEGVTLLPTAAATAAPAAATTAQPTVAMPLASPANAQGWLAALDVEAQRLLATGATDVWDQLTRQFEATLIQAALASTKGRRIEAAQKLGIGRNTISRKIQELGLEE